MADIMDFIGKRLRVPGLDPVVAESRVLRSREIAVVGAELRLGDGETPGGVPIVGGGGDVDYAPLAEELPVVPVQNKLKIEIDMVVDFGADIENGTPCEPAFNRMIAHINSIGNENAATSPMFSVLLPDGEYNLLAGNLDPIEVANVTIYHNGGAKLRIANNPVFTLGSATKFQDQFSLTCWTITDPNTIPNSTACLVKGVQHARAFIDVRCNKLACVYYAHPASGMYCGNVDIIARGTGIVDRYFVDIDTSASGYSGSGLRCTFNDLYAKDILGAAMPLNPFPVPAVITNITAATPPVITTAADHQIPDGARVSIRGANSNTHQANGAIPLAGETLGTDDYIFTKLTATTGSLKTLAGANVNGSGWSAYSNGGFIAQRHFSFPHQKAAVRIKGRYDTILITGIVQHWANAIEMEPIGGSISFLDIFDFYADYIGSSMMFVKMSGGVLSDVRLSDGWTFTLDHDWIRYTYDGLVGGTITGLCVNNWRIGLLGGVPFNDIYGITRQPTMIGVEARSCVRSRGGNANAITISSAISDPTIIAFKMVDPETFWGAGVRPGFLPYGGIVLTNADNSCTITNCYTDVRTGGEYYAIPKGGNKVLSANRCQNGAIPEHGRRKTVTVTTGTFTWTNNTGADCRVRITGGTVTSIDISNSAASEQQATSTGQTIFVARNEVLSITNSSAPTMTYVMLDC